MWYGKPQEYIRISRIWRTAWRQKDKARFAIYCRTERAALTVSHEFIVFHVLEI
jgi:hypothetical protein